MADQMSVADLTATRDGKRRKDPEGILLFPGAAAPRFRNLGLGLAGYP